jgi:predicted restriction endonuclease
MLRNFNDPQYKLWRKNVYKRDNYKCQWPGCNCNKKLNAHHIKTWSEYPGLRFVVDNGITLCKDHHKMIKNLEHIYEAVFLRIVANKKNSNEK